MGTKNRHGNQAPPTSGLANALFTATQQRVLSLLFGRPERSFFTREIIELVASGTGGVQRELKRLAQAGLVTLSTMGNQKRYQANQDSPIFAELHGIVRKTMGIRAILTSALAPVENKVVEAFVFGSVAKHEDRADSDIDLLVVSDDLLLEDVYRAVAVAEKLLGRRINPTLYSEDDYQRRKRENNPFLSKVLAGPVMVVIQRQHA